MTAATNTWALHYLQVARQQGLLTHNQFHNRAQRMIEETTHMTAQVVPLHSITGNAVLDYIDPLAGEAAVRAENMTGTQLDDWYEEHVGYRPSVDDPGLCPQMHAAQVACVMYLHSLPEGPDDPLYSEQAEVMIHAYFGLKPTPAPN